MALGGCMSAFTLAAENPPAWDDTREASWGAAISRIDITSTVDGTLQHAMWHGATAAAPQPLIVSLHTWSGDYTQKDPLAAVAVARGFNYIHPDFRGPNNKPAACGSNFVVSDIDDAIDYALACGNVDRANIHVIGASGGGHATMLAWMRSRHDMRSFSAWVGVSDLVKWHQESAERGARYATDLCLATTGDAARFDPAEAKKRSPLFLETPLTRRQRSKLLLHAGVHDGYTGSVPISQTINFYNHVIRELAPGETGALVPSEIAEVLVRQRGLPTERGGARQHGETIYQRQFQDRIRLVIFEGGHEMLVEQALDHVPSITILAVGDSNGAVADGWVAQLQSLRFRDVVINASIGGSTIGFDNLDNPALNTLRNIDGNIARAVGQGGTIDVIVLLLGTNDSKAVFAGRQREVGANLERLLERIRAHPLLQSHPPEILVISPPPMGPAEKLDPKYLDGPARVESLVAELREVAARNQCRFVDIHTPLKAAVSVLTEDGVHLIPVGQMLVARLILAEGFRAAILHENARGTKPPEPAAAVDPLAENSAVPITPSTP